MREELPGRFPDGFSWTCGCGDVGAGFPGCEVLTHFCRKVCIALIDYHQIEETIDRGVLTADSGGRAMALKPDLFSEERKALLAADTEKALRILEANRVKP